jgi:hypothetical protein
MIRSMLAAGLTAAIAVAAPAAADVTKPTVTTGGAAQVTQSSATLTGKVNPNGAQTTYFFQYGLTKAYGTSTGPTDAGSGTNARTAAANLTGLAPFAKYHYRLVAENAKGKTFGGDRTFTTKKQPLGVSLASNPNPVTWGAGMTISGQITGTGNANRTVKLQQKAFPYTSNFTDVLSPSVTDGNGNFAFFVPLLTVNTQFRITTVGTPRVTSAPLIVGSAVRVGFKVNHRRVHRGSRVRFSGHVTPANDGALFAIQRLSKGQWLTVAGGSVKHGTATSSRYRKTLHIRHFGKYRVFVGVNNQNTSGISREIRIRKRG